MVETCLRATATIKKDTSNRKHFDMADLFTSLPDTILCDILDKTLQNKGLEAFKQEILQLNVSRKTLIPLMNKYMREYKTDVIKELLEFYRKQDIGK